jgi:hypothetical protein
MKKVKKKNRSLWEKKEENRKREKNGGKSKIKIKMGNKTSIEKRRCCLFGPMIPCKQCKKRIAI